MIVAVIIAIVSALILYISYLASAMVLFGPLTDLVANSTYMTADSVTTFNTIKVLYKLGIAMLWVTILAFLAIMSQRDERVDYRRRIQ